MSRRAEKQKKRKAFLGLLCLVALFALGCLVASKLESKLFPDVAPGATPHVPGQETLVYNGSTYRPKQKLQTTLVLGLDKFGPQVDSGSYNNPAQSDMLLLLIRDRANGSSRILQLNRDTMTEITILGIAGQRAGEFIGQLALAHTYGSGREDSCRNSVRAVSKLLLGQKIDHYMSLSMDAVGILTDWAGGVPVLIEDDFSRVDPTLVMGQTVTLQGQQSLDFVRARGEMVDDSNLRRMARQRQFIASWTERAKQKLTNEAEMASLLVDLGDYFLTDCSANELAEFAQSMTELSGSELYTLQGEAVLGEEFMEYYVDEDAKMKTILELFYDEVEPAQTQESGQVNG